MQMNNQAPKGYSTVCPYIMVNDVEKQMQFLQTAFNATIKENLKGPDGLTMHGEVQIGNIVLLIGLQTKEIPAQPGMNYVYVDNVHQPYANAMGAGALSITQPTDRFYGVSEAGFKDLHGNTWWAAHFLINESDDMYGYSTVCPYLVVTDVARQAEFLQTVFNAGVKDMAKQPEGEVVQAEMKIGDVVVIISKSSDELPAQPGMNYVYVNDVDDTYKKAINAGAASITEPAERFYGAKEGGFKDTEGNTWWVAQFKGEVTKEDMDKGIAEAAEKRK
jgi:PhnB protein